MKTLRTGLVALLLVWMIGGPVARQVFNSGNPFLPGWHMYRGFATGLFSVRMYRMEAGHRVPVDRVAALGFPVWREAPMGVRRVRSPEQLQRQITQVCRALGPEVDLRVEARLAKVDGWRTVLDGRRDLCR